MLEIKLYHAKNDGLKELTTTAETLDEVTLTTGHGAYAVFRLYPGQKALYLKAHLDRIRRSMESLGEPYALTNRWLRQRLNEAVQASGMAMPKIRLTVPYENPETALIALQPFTPPSGTLLEEGVKTCLCEGGRERPEVKDSRFVEERSAIWEKMGPDCYEVFLIDQGCCVREGLTSNFFAIRDGILFTAGEGVLKGIARRLVLEVAQDIMEIQMEAVREEDLAIIEGAFLTSSSRGPVPVIQIGDTLVGGGEVGSLFKAIRAAYDARVEKDLEDILPA